MLFACFDGLLFYCALACCLWGGLDGWCALVGWMLLNCFVTLYCLCDFGLVGLMVLANCLFMYLAFVYLRLVFVLVLAWV